MSMLQAFTGGVMRKILLLSLGLLIIALTIPEWGRSTAAAANDAPVAAVPAKAAEEPAKQEQQTASETPVFSRNLFYIFIVLSIACWFIVVRRKFKAPQSGRIEKIYETPTRASISRLAELTPREKEFIRRYFG